MINSAWLLTGKKALITGGTKGIGKAVNDEFLKLGAETAVVARDQDELDRLSERYFTQGKKILCIKADVSRIEDRVLIYNTVHEKWGGLDIFVNNVGTNIRKSSLEYSNDE